MEALKKTATEQQTQTHHNQQTPFLLSALINSFSIYSCDPTPSAYSFIIKTLTQNSQFDQLPFVLDHIQNVENFEPPEQIFSHLIRVYGYANRIDDAVELFSRIPSFRCTPSALSLNALLSVLCKRKECLQMVYPVLLKAQVMGVRLEESSFRIIINALCKIKKIGYAIQMLEMMFEYGFDPDSTLYSCILSAMCKIKGISSVEVLGFFEVMRQKRFSLNMLDYTNVISLLVKVGKGMDSLGLLEDMKLDGIKPDVVVYTIVLDGVIASGEFNKAEELFDEMLVLGIVPDVQTYNVYLKGICMQDKFEAGFKLVFCMEELGCKPDVITYNTLIGALCKVGKVRRANEVLRKMRLKGFQENLHTYNMLIEGLVSEGEVVEACKLFEDMLNKGFVPMSFTCDVIIGGLCKKGLISQALQILKEMVKRDTTPGFSAWESLLSMSKMSLKEATSIDLVLS
ncbi:Pentatricopeptide repeat-containing protein [Thalictrum thalictroides]|uniref:Pentatricopeptide repeat-containing protein n=1 Tax=Thalictrum thalictroides TaxID=46969 RepID=A0A7J6VF88_THATH|nr:Pentatricopeptide repeat-containing protein [Thalictrum thalictroides]